MCRAAADVENRGWRRRKVPQQLLVQDVGADLALDGGVSAVGEGVSESCPLAHSHSMVPGGFDVTSRATRFTSRTSFVMRVEMRASTSYGTRVQSAVMASSLETGRSTTGCP